MTDPTGRHQRLVVLPFVDTQKESHELEQPEYFLPAGCPCKWTKTLESWVCLHFFLCHVSKEAGMF